LKSESWFSARFVWEATNSGFEPEEEETSNAGGSDSERKARIPLKGESESKAMMVMCFTDGG
jgi:hypothetical protein